MSRPLSVIVMGLGNRGSKYAKLMSVDPEHYNVVGVAEPDHARRDEIQEIFGLSDDVCFDSWDEILAQPKMADLAVIAMVDDMHYEPAMRAIELGYNLLLEKPVAPTAKECADIANAAKEKGVEVLVCHVLRYAPFYVKVKELLMEGIIGDVMSAEAVEGVEIIHQSHSYVRGNWHCEAESSPMLLAKSCHDLDILQWLLDKPCKKIQSFGALTHFTEANAPEGSPIRCADGTCPVRDTCIFNCIKMYHDNERNHRRRIITKGIAKTPVPTNEEVMEALKTTDYGLCVYHANNDVVDHQTVNMVFEGDVTVTFNMNAFNKGGRYIRLFGTKGELYARAADTEITIRIYGQKEPVLVSVPKVEESIVGGHGGGDQGIIQELHQYMSGEYNGFRAANIHTSVRNHMLCFAAEESRHNDTVVRIDDYMKRYDLDNNY
ncbi:MAG: Gfo/Idh/MocA family oxidoreductase [Clostridia bacterium]|nr:Gfo/Idh/MocA family oxidoreductase [Clostridia bacterium]